MISREGGPNKGEGLHYEAMQYFLKPVQGSISYNNPYFPQDM